MIPDRINDGYTLPVSGGFVRRMPLRYRKRVFNLIRSGAVRTAVDTVFSPPWFFGAFSGLSECRKEVIWKSILEWPDEQQSHDNLISGVRLRCEHPEAADFSCDTCRKFIVDYDRWKVRDKPGGGFYLRPVGGEILCEIESGCVRGDHGSSALNEVNTMAWNHYWEWKQAGMPLPECPVMRWNWKVIEWIAINGRIRKLRPSIRGTA